MHGIAPIVVVMACHPHGAFLNSFIPVVCRFYQMAFTGVVLVALAWQLRLARAHMLCCWLHPRGMIRQRVSPLAGSAVTVRQ